MPLQVFVSYALADDLLPVGSGAQHGFVSLLRANLAHGLARRGLTNVVVSRASLPNVRGTNDAAPADFAFGKLLRQHRLAAGLSQEMLAERAGMSVNGISNIERGDRRNPQRATIELLANALDLDTEARRLFEVTAGRTVRRIDGLPGDAVRADTEHSIPNESAIRESQIFVAILTPAALGSDHCRFALEAFVDRWKGEPNFDERFAIVSRSRLEREELHPALLGRQMFRFYAGGDDAGLLEIPLYRNDGTPARAFYDVVDALAESILTRSSALGLTQVAVPRVASRTTIYVAPAARDMSAQYRTVVAELRTAGYVVAPDPIARIPDGPAGVAFIDASLARAALSIHLLGEDRDERTNDESLAALQMQRAAQRARSAEPPAFSRIVFAPKVFIDIDGETATRSGRDPLAVRDGFGQRLESDTVIGDGINDFVAAIKELIRKRTRAFPVETPAALREGSAVFLDFHPADVDYAQALSVALREHGLRSRFAAFEDDRIQNRLTYAALARDADAVIYCWANATDAWLYAEAADYADWQKLGRSGPFATRAAIAGPPVRVTKKLYSRESPPESIDLFVNLTDRVQPVAADLDPLMQQMSPPESP